MLCNCLLKPENEVNSAPTNELQLATETGEKAIAAKSPQAINA